MNNIYAFFIFALFAMTTQTSFANIFNPDFSKVEKVDNLWDGVNSKNEVQVFNQVQDILVDGSWEQQKFFGACPRVGDIDGDGKDELVVSDGKGFVWVYKLGNKARNRKIYPVKFYHTYFGDSATLALNDWNNDGKLDLICGNNIGTLIFCKNKGGGLFIDNDNQPRFSPPNENSFPAKVPFPFVNEGSKPLDIGNFSAPYVIDWNKDGKQDLILGEGSYSANSVYFYKNTGSTSNPDFSKKQRYWLAYGYGREQLVPAIGDIDGDGDLDLLVGDRLGYIYLYLNEPHKTSDKKEKYLLTDKGPIAFNGKKRSVGQLVRPELTDWDGDGDLDLLIGESSGKVFISMNNGNRKNPVFTDPKPLLSKDKFKFYLKPKGWKICPIWVTRAASHPNSGAYLHYMSETNETGGIVHFARYEFADGFVGYPQWLCSAIGHNIPFDSGKSYSFVIDCRATGLKECKLAFEHYENAFVNKDTKKEAWPRAYYFIKPGAAWQNVKTTVRFEPFYSENKFKLKVIHKWFRMNIRGKKNLKLDLKNIYVQ